MKLVSFFGGACRAVVMAALAALALGAFAASAFAATTGFGIKNFESGTCTENGQATAAEECTYKTESKFYTKAAGHPPFGITFFEFNSSEVPGFMGFPGQKAPDGNVKNIRTDLPLGLSVNPQATKSQCTMEEFGEIQIEEGVFTKPECEEDTKVGTNVLTVTLEAAPDEFINEQLEGTAYNLVSPEGVPLEIGVAVNITSLVEEKEKVKLAPGTFYAHTLLEGGISWHGGETYATPEEAANKGSQEMVPHSGNYHEYFRIDNVSKEIPIVASRLIFEGQSGTGFLTMPSSCGAATTDLWVESYEGETDTKPTTPPAEVSNCKEVPFEPKVNVKPTTTVADAPDGATVEVLVPQNEHSAQINSSTLAEAKVTLPEGMTLNPAAANGLTACTNAQFGKGLEKAVECPETSKIGTVDIETPTLPKGAMTGNVYVGTPESNSPASGGEYRIFIAAESKRYGVDIRLEGRIKANETTGQLTTLVAENPPIPFSDFELKLENGTRTPLANPITCAAQSTTGSFTPSSTGVAVAGTLVEAFTTTGCATFAPTQTTKVSDSQGGASTSFAFELTRPEGQPYVSTVSTTLPPGLVGKLPSVPFCTEAQASSATCPATSAIGTSTVEIGSGTVPLGLSGTVYLTEAYSGAPYGLDIVTNAEKVGPYNYGLINTRAKIEVNPSTAQVTVASQLPTVVGGAPIRLRALNITVTHPNFMINPTNCAALSTSTALTATTGASAKASSPFQATGCSSLKFKPTFKAGSNGNPSRKNGASLKTTLTLPAGGANVKSVSVTLPKRLPSRSSTLNQACLLATFEANPASCPKASQVGTASVVTPVLRGTLKGTAYYVSLGHAGFPNLDVVLKGDGITIVLVGQTNIKGGITHTKFLTLPDVPVKTFTLQLPMKENSALSANASLCDKPLYLPTTMVAQNGAKFTQNTRINMTACPVLITKHKVKGKTVQLTVKTPSAGKIVASGTNLVSRTKKVAKAKVATITETLSAAGARKLARQHKLSLAVRVKFTPTSGKASTATLKATVKG